MASIVPSERLRRELDDLVAGVGDEDDPIEAIGRLGARLILQQALEEELSEFLGRERYERRGEPVAHRNGYERVTVKTTAGPLELERPRVRNASARVLAAWDGMLQRRKLLLGLQLGSHERYDDWLDFGRDLLARGARPTALIVADGAPGLWKAARELWPAALQQRCTVHALRNVTKKLPERLHRELKARYWRILDEASSVAEARAGLLALVADYRRGYPAAMAVIEHDLDALICHLRFPSQHRKRIRSTNLLERTFVEVRRRTKVIGRFPGETSALRLIWSVLEP